MIEPGVTATGPTTKCHNCGCVLTLQHGRGMTTLYPCCKSAECTRARDRKYEAGWRARRHAQHDDEMSSENLSLRRQVVELKKQLAIAHGGLRLRKQAAALTEQLQATQKEG